MQGHFNKCVYAMDCFLVLINKELLLLVKLETTVSVRTEKFLSFSLSIIIMEYLKILLHKKDDKFYSTFFFFLQFYENVISFHVNTACFLHLLYKYNNVP